jgi:hypothetical protein
MMTAMMKPYVYSALNTYALAATPFNTVTCHPLEWLNENG